MKSSVVTKFENGTADIVTTIKNFPNKANRAKLMFTVGSEGIPKKSQIKADHIVVSVGYLSENKLYQELKPENVMKAVWDAYDAARVI